MKSFIIAAAAIMTAAFATNANAVTVFEPDLADDSAFSVALSAGLTIDFSATDMNGNGSFPITAIDTSGDTLIFHDGAFITVTNPNSSNGITVRNFIVNATQETLAADVEFFGASTDTADDVVIATFNPAIGTLTNINDPDVPVLFNDAFEAAIIAAFPTLSQTLTGVLADIDFRGFVATDLQIDPSAIPLPAGAWIFLAGLGALGFSRRRQ